MTTCITRLLAGGWLITATLSLHAQCVPGPFNGLPPGIYPDSLDNGIGCQYFQQDVTFILPRDTATNIGGVPFTFPFNSFTINTVDDLPQGMTWECNFAPTCEYITHPDSAQADTIGCIRLSGTPTVPASYVLKVRLTANVIVFGTLTPTNFTYEVPFTVTPCQFTGNCYTLALSSNCEPSVLSLTNNLPSGGVAGITYQWQVNGDNGFSYTTADENPTAQFLTDPGTYTVQYETTIDTVGYILNGVTINAVNCGDIGSAGDLYWILKDPSGAELVNTSASPVNNGGASLPLNTGISGIFLQNGVYELQVWDEDAVLNDQGCASGAIGSGSALTISIPPSSTGAIPVTSGGLSVTFSIDRPIQTITCSDTFVISPLPQVAPVVLAGDTLPADSLTYCAGTSLTLAVTTTDSVQWLRNGSPVTGATDTLLVVSTPGVYEATLISRTSFCENSTAPVTVSEMLILPPSIAFNGNNTLLVAAPNPGYTYEWYKGGILQGSGAVWTAVGSGDYYCIAVSNANGCRSLPSPTLSIIVAGLDALTDLVAGWEVFPNPAQDLIQVRLDLHQPATAEIAVLDLAGRTLMSYKAPQGLHLDHSLDLHTLPTGLYLLQVQLPGGVLRQQVVKW